MTQSIGNWLIIFHDFQMLCEKGMDMIGLSFIFSLCLVGGTFSLIISLQAIYHPGALRNGRAQQKVGISFEH